MNRDELWSKLAQKNPRLVGDPHFTPVETPETNASDSYETVEALLCEMQGVRDELEEAKRERNEARMECMILKKEMRRLLETLACKRAAETKESS